METQPSMNQGNVTNVTGLTNRSLNSQTNPFLADATAVSPAQSAPMTPKMQRLSVYPEIFYKLQPFILVACDQLDAYSAEMPTQEMTEQMTDNIYNEAAKTYPEIAKYARSAESVTNDDPADPPAVPAFRPGLGSGAGPGIGFGPGFNFRRRGVPRDLIEILLLQELFGRRRRRFY